MTSWASEGLAATFNVAAGPPSPLSRLLAALGRHAHQLACEASRTADGTVFELLAADQARVLARIDALEPR